MATLLFFLDALMQLNTLNIFIFNFFLFISVQKLKKKKGSPRIYFTYLTKKSIKILLKKNYIFF